MPSVKSRSTSVPRWDWVHFPKLKTTIFPKKGINVISNTWNLVGFRQYGNRIGLFQEDGDHTWSNHSMYKLTDLLSLGNALSQLDPTLHFPKLPALVSAGSNQMSASYEGVVDELRRL